MFAAGDILGRVADHDDLWAIQFAPEVVAALGRSGDGDEVAILVVVGETAQRKPAPKPVRTELAIGSGADVAGQQANRRRVRQSRQVVEHPHHAGERPALVRVKMTIHEAKVVAEK